MCSIYFYLIVSEFLIFRSRTLVAGSGWEEDEPDEDDELTKTTSAEQGSTSIVKQREKLGLGFKFRKAVNQEANSLLDEAIVLYKKKNSLKKAVDFLVKNNFMSDTGKA